MQLHCRHLVLVDDSGASTDHHDNDFFGRSGHEIHRPMRRHSNRPLVERLPCVRIRDIAKVIPRRNPHEVYCLDSFGLRYPGKVLLSMNGIKITDAAIVPQFFRLAWVRTAGKPRPLIVCQCRRKAQILYFYSGRYACKHCHKADYLCQHLSKGRQKLWQSARLRLQMGYQAITRCQSGQKEFGASTIIDS